MSQIPEPPDTGSAGTQQATIQSESPEPHSPLAGLPIVTTVEGLAATRSRSMGGGMAASLIAGSFTQLSHELAATKQDLRVAQNELNKKQEELTQEKILSATLQTQITSLSNEKNIRHACLMGGSGILGYGIDQLIEGVMGPGLAFIILGLALALVGLVSFNRSKK